MPSTSKFQAKLMQMCANPKTRKKARKKCPPIKVAREFVSADKRKRGK